MRKAKRILALVLAAVMLLALAACGKDGEQGSTPGTTKETPAPEFVYTSSYKTLSTGANGMNAQLFTEDGFYSVESEKVGEKEHDQPAEYEGQYDIYEQVIYFVGFDGNRTKLENYEPIRPDSDTEGHDYGSYISALIQGQDGQLITLDNTWDNWNDAPEGVEMYSDEWYNYYQYEEHYYFRVLDATGKELSRSELNVNTADGGYFSPYSMIAGENGTVICCCDQGVIGFDPATGEQLFTIEMSNYPDKLIRLTDGRVVVSNWGENGNQLTVVDVAAKSLGENIPFDGDTYNTVSGSGDYDLYFTSGTNFYGYKLETQEKTKLFNWISCDVNNDNLSGFAVNAEGQILGLINTWDSNYENCTCELVTISKQPYDPSTEKTVLTLATQYVNWNDRDTIIKFNRNSDKYRIEVLDYSEYNTEEDYEAGLTKLKTEIMAGNLPDIICLNGLDGSLLSAKGLIVDLYPYMDADSEFSRDDFFPNVLKAVEENGKLYSTVGSFYIQTVAGASSVVGTEPGWTYADLEAALATMPEGCEPFDHYTTRDDILQTSLMLDMDDYVNWSTGECNFDSQQFIDLLNFANKFPAEFDWDNYEWSDEDDSWNRIAQGKQMLISANLSDFDSSILQYQTIFGGDVDDVTFIGFPTNNGVGSMLGIDSGYAITKNCKDPEAAWQFLRSFFTEDFQKGLWNFPSNKNAFNAKLKEAMTPEYMTDGEGNYILDENGNKIEQSQGGFGWGDGAMVEIYAMTQEQADKLMELIESTEKVANYDSAIYDIVTEQAAAFFAGQKSAEEVAKLVQSKANIFVNEQR